MGNIMDMPLWCWKDDDVICLAPPRNAVRPATATAKRAEGKRAESKRWLRLRPVLPTLSETFETGVKKNNYVVPLKTRERQKKIRINSFFL